MIKDTNVTVGRGGKVTISRQRGRSIDRDVDEAVQPTGIPAHMRRQPSPPPPRTVPRTIPRSVPRQLSAPHQPPPYKNQSSDYRQYKQSYSPLQPVHPQTFAVRTKTRRPPGYEEWTDDRGYEYRHRSRSPLQPAYLRERYRELPPAVFGRMAHSRTPSPERRGGRQRSSSVPSERWMRPRSPSLVEYREHREYHRPMRRMLARSPSPPSR